MATTGIRHWSRSEWVRWIFRWNSTLYTIPVISLRVRLMLEGSTVWGESQTLTTLVKHWSMGCCLRDSVRFNVWSNSIQMLTIDPSRIDNYRANKITYLMTWMVTNDMKSNTSRIIKMGTKWYKKYLCLFQGNIFGAFVYGVPRAIFPRLKVRLFCDIQLTYSCITLSELGAEMEFFRCCFFWPFLDDVKYTSWIKQIRNDSNDAECIPNVGPSTFRNCFSPLSIC